MTENESELKRFILPFSVLSENRKEPFSAELELATLFSLAEMDRAKSGGLLSRHAEEKIDFIVKTGYPLWLFPWSGTTYIFDGLGRSSHTLRYPLISDVRTFGENLLRSSRNPETYLAFLSDHINYFQAPLKENSFLIKGLISDPEFLKDFNAYSNEAKSIEDQSYRLELFSPIIDESTISSILEEMRTLYLSFEEDVEKLFQCIKLINSSTSDHVKELRKKSRNVKREYKVKILGQKSMVTPKISRLNHDYDHQIVQATRSFERQRLIVQKQKVKLEKSREKALEKIDKCRLEAKTCAEDDDSVGEQKWKEKVNSIKKEISQTEDQIREKEEALRDLEDRKSLKIFNLKSELESKTKEANQPLLELESSLDAEILIHKQEIEKVEKQTKIILNQIGQTTKLMERIIGNFSKLGIKNDQRLKSTALFYVPFYIVCYELESRKRYVFLPPSEANSIGFSTKLKRVLGKPKIKQLLVTRFETLIALMDTAKVLAQQNVVFETEMRQIGEKTNILDQDSMLEKIKKGLEYIKEEGWISEKEYQVLRQKII